MRSSSHRSRRLSGRSPIVRNSLMTVLQQSEASAITLKLDRWRRGRSRRAWLPRRTRSQTATGLEGVEGMSRHRDVEVRPNRGSAPLRETRLLSRKGGGQRWDSVVGSGLAESVERDLDLLRREGGGRPRLARQAYCRDARGGLWSRVCRCTSGFGARGAEDWQLGGAVPERRILRDRLCGHHAL
jgi:hypothetical protein